MTGAALSQGQVFVADSALSQGRFRGSLSAFTRSGVGFEAGAALSQSQVHVLWQA